MKIQHITIDVKVIRKKIISTSLILFMRDVKIIFLSIKKLKLRFYLSLSYQSNMCHIVGADCVRN